MDLGFSSPREVNPPRLVEPGFSLLSQFFNFRSRPNFCQIVIFLAPHVFLQSVTADIGLYTRFYLFFSYPGFPG